MDKPENPIASVCDTPWFHLMVDEALRENACRAVETFLSDHNPVKNVQLHAIPNIIQAGGLAGLRDLIENQKSKNTKKENKAFWEFLADLILAQPGPDHSLRAFVRDQIEFKELFADENPNHEKKELKRVRKANKKVMDDLLDILIDRYFEHFNSHYFYMTGGGA